MSEPVYYGIIKGNVVILPEGVYLGDGIRVEVRVPDNKTTAEMGAEDQFKERLHDLGLLLEIRRSPYPPVEGDRTPARVEGQPLSEMIIEERR